MRMWSACSTKHQKSNADVCGWLWDREDMHPKIQTLSTNMPSTWPSEALWVNYWNPKSADPRRVWKGNNKDKKSGKYNVFTFCPAAVDLLKKGCLPLPPWCEKCHVTTSPWWQITKPWKRIKLLDAAAIFELPWSVASLLRFAGCIPDHISTYENSGVLHYHDAKILVVPLVPTSTP